MLCGMCVTVINQQAISSLIMYSYIEAVNRGNSSEASL